MLLHTSPWLQWLLCMNVALNLMITPDNLLIWHHLTNFLFPNLKKNLAGKQYQTDDKVISAVNDFLEDQDESFYTKGIQAMHHRWEKCRGDYVEEKNCQIRPLHRSEPMNCLAHPRTLSIKRNLNHFFRTPLKRLI